MRQTEFPTREEARVMTDRRQWIQGVIRNGTLGGIAVVASYLAARRLQGDCSRPLSACRSCQLLSSCSVPTARAVRTTSAD